MLHGSPCIGYTGSARWSGGGEEAIMLRVALCDDHPIVREGIRGVLSRQSDIRIEVETSTGSELLREIAGKKIDVIVLDITLPDMNGLDVLKTLQGEGNHAAVLMLSMHPEEHYAVRVLKGGAAGYLQKESVAEELVAAVRTVAQGKKYVTQTLAERLALDLHDKSTRPPHELLSDREYQVLCMLAAGKPIKQIAAELALSAPTIATYRARVLEKLGLSSTVDLVRYALEHKLVE
jgi:two-component system, NarL family, invasion response regulator UvrY